MAVRCPNKNTREWKELVNNLGEDMAYRAFIANNESLPDLDTVRDIISLYTEEVDTSTEISEDSIRSIYEESRSEHTRKVANIEISGVENKYRPSDDHLFHGTNTVEVDKETGELVLRPSINFRTVEAISLTHIPVVAGDYAMRKGGTKIIKIDKEHVPNRKVSRENEFEIAVKDKEELRIPKDGYYILEVEDKPAIIKEKKSEASEIRNRLETLLYENPGRAIIQAISIIKKDTSLPDIGEFLLEAGEYSQEAENIPKREASEFLRELENRYREEDLSSLRSDFIDSLKKNLRTIGAGIPVSIRETGEEADLFRSISKETKELVPFDVDRAIQDNITKEEEISLKKTYKESVEEGKKETRDKIENRKEDEDEDLPFQRKSKREEESRELLEKKKQVLKENFSNAGIDVNIREEAIDKGIAYVETKEGENPTIVLDPQKVRGDTLMHEFGHIYIDMLGYESGVIQEGIERLRNGDIWKEVERNYPDLGQEEFEKEVLATAIGREGVRTEENPSKFKVWINKLIRKIAELLGISKNSARTLAEEMWKGQLRVREFQGGLSTAVQEQREEAGEEEILSDYEKKRRQDAEEAYKDITDLADKVDRVKGILKRNVEELKERARKQGRQKELKAMEEQMDALKNVQKVEDMVGFFDMAYNNVRKARSKMRSIMAKISQGSSEVDENDIRKAVEAFNFLKEFDIVEEFNQELSTDESLSEEERKIADNINAILRESKEVQEDFINEIIPVQADFLLNYQGDGINEELQKMIDNAEWSKEQVRQGKRNTTRTPGIHKSRHYYQKRKRRAKNEGWYNTKDWELEKADIYIQQIKDEHLVNRKNLINMLKKEFTKKSQYSFYADPTIYSSDQSIQMFAKAVKNALYRANNDSHETKASIQEYYEEFKKRSGKSDENTSKFNEDIIETIKLPDTDPDTGEVLTDDQGNIKTREYLGFVQPYDVSSYYFNARKLYKEGEKLGRPSLKDTDIESYKEWLKTEQGKKWRKMQADWLKENTQPIEGAEKELQELRNEYNKYESKIKELDKEIENAEQQGNSATILRKDRADYISLLNEIEQEISSLTMSHPETGERLFKGRLTKPSEKYKNPKYEKLMSDPNKEAAREYYKNMLEVYQNSQDKIELRTIKNNSWDRYTYMLPAVRKAQYDRLHEQGLFKTARDSSEEATQVQATDTEYGISVDAQGNDIKEVPIFFTNYVDAKDVSMDVASSVIQFEHMANMYKHRSDIQGRAMLMKEIIKRREKPERNSSGELSMDNTLKKLGIRRPTKERDTDWHYRQLDEFVDNALFDEKMIKQQIGNLEATKASGSLAKATALNTLSLNVLQGLNNTIIGRVFGWAEAAGGDLYSAKNFWKAGNIFLQQKGAIQDVGKIKNRTKLGQLVELYDPVQGEITTMMGKAETGSKAKKTLSSDPLMFMQRGGEYEMHSRTMIAAMLEMTAKDKNGDPVKNDKGNNMSLWEAYHVDPNDGKLKLDERVNFTEKDRMNLMNRIHGVNKKLHGAYSDFDKGMLKRRAIGQLIFLFRGWFPPGIRKRWGHGNIFSPQLHVDHESGEISEGTYHSSMRLIREFIKEGRLTLKDMTDMEKANIRRNLAEQMFVLGMVGLVLGFSTGDEDDENNYIENMILYQAARTRAEIMFYYNPNDFRKIFKSPTATNKTVDNVFNLLFQASEDIMTLSPEKYEREVGQYPKGTYKIRKDVNDILPVMGQFRKDPEKAAQWFTMN